MKKLFITFLSAVVFLIVSADVSRANQPVDVYFFYGEGCPHCAKELAFLNEIKKNYPDLNIRMFEIYHNSENAQIFQKVASSLGIKANGVPFAVIGDEYVIGFSEKLTPGDLERTIKKCSELGCESDVDEIIASTASESGKNPDGNEKASKGEAQENESGAKNNNAKIITLPLIGEINPYAYSLPVLAVVLGIIDGFNPCAMWVLLFLISLLIGMEDKCRRWILGTAFIVASAAVYFVFMAAWLNLVIFVGMISWVKYAIAAVAIAGGLYSLKGFREAGESGCVIAGNENRQKVFTRLKSSINERNFLLALLGIVALAFMVNLIELLCSAGLPVVFTQILAMNSLPTWQYYAYILLYILFFMIDDLFVFFVAMFTLELTGITTKYTKYARLFGGIIMLAIGLMILFKPEWLMFG